MNRRGDLMTKTESKLSRIKNRIKLTNKKRWGIPVKAFLVGVYIFNSPRAKTRGKQYFLAIYPLNFYSKNFVIGLNRIN